MKLRDIMTQNVICIHPEEPVEVAARLLTRYNVGALPVCTDKGALCGVVTDRDIVTRCIAAGKNTAGTRVRDVMTARLICAPEDLEAEAAAKLMGDQQIRRLPVVKNGRLCGMVSLSDLAPCTQKAAHALEQISSNISAPKNLQNFENNT